MKRRLVYTALIGDYEEFVQCEPSFEANIDFYVFTDLENLYAPGWHKVVIKPRFLGDSSRSVRYLKMLVDDVFRAYDESLWIDNTVSLRSSASVLLDRLLPENFDVGLFVHSFRPTVLAEFSAVANSGYDDITRVFEQLFHYQNDAPSILSERPFWGGIIGRRHSDAVLEAMRLWYEQVLRFSRRDQLSLNYVLSKSEVRVNSLNLDNQSSPYHQWPVDTHRRSGGASRNSFYEAAIQIPILKLATLERELSDSKQEQLNLQALASDHAQRLKELRERSRSAATRNLDQILRLLAKSSNVSVYIWGSGLCGQKLRALLKKRNIAVTAILTSNAASGGVAAQVVALDARGVLMSEQNRCFVFIASSFYEEIQRVIADAELTTKHDFLHVEVDSLNQLESDGARGFNFG